MKHTAKCTAFYHVATLYIAHSLEDGCVRPDRSCTMYLEHGLCITQIDLEGLAPSGFVLI